LMEEARTFVAEGARELIITGVSMGDWKGIDDFRLTIDDSTRRARNAAQSTLNAPENRQSLIINRQSRNLALCDLLRAVATIEGLERVRVSSLDPADVDEAWLQTLARTDKICPQIHLALQSGSASTLRRMRRRYTPDLFLKWAKLWREIRPDGALTTDIIVGFPGETEEEWQQTLRVAREAHFSHIHVFPFSPRDDTHAASLPDAIDSATQKRRVDELLLLAAALSRDYAAQFIGQSLPILIETIAGDGTIEGMTPHYLKCRARSTLGRQKTLQIGDVIEVSMREWDGSALLGMV